MNQAPDSRFSDGVFMCWEFLFVHATTCVMISEANASFLSSFHGKLGFTISDSIIVQTFYGETNHEERVLA
jgi:hypothetical protein